ncbi:hypothetical protein ACKU27_10870 [Sphingobium yanoikuyae]|uniref:hypothetical protein n=1 Tax=Sphingobium yanoikuyae TaxID=13690 RepID=UPI003B8FC530
MSKCYADLVDLTMPIGHYIDQAKAALGDDLRLLRIDLMPGKAKSWQIFASDNEVDLLTPPGG